MLKKSLLQLIDEADAVLIGAGAGLSTSAGFIYTGERFTRYFSDFAERYGFSDMYSGGFYPYKTPEELWAFWSRYVYINRYMDPPKPVYDELYKLVREKDYFVLTTNVDHCFQKAGFDKHRIFYTQGDYGLWQCSVPCHQKTYDNQPVIEEMVLSQGFTIDADGTLLPPENGSLRMTVPTELIPRCPRCGKPMSMNLRSDMTFVEDGGWNTAAMRYEDFVRRHKKMKTLYIELGVGMNTPGIIKYNFWRQVYTNPQAVYVCINYGESYAPQEIEDRSLCINDDIGAALR